MTNGRKCHGCDFDRKFLPQEVAKNAKEFRTTDFENDGTVHREQRRVFIRKPGEKEGGKFLPHMGGGGESHGSSTDQFIWPAFSSNSLFH